MDALLSQIDWTFRSAIYLATGLGIVCPLLWICKYRKSWLEAISQIPGFSANAQTIWRVPVTWLGYILMIYGYHYVGFCIATFGLTMDRVDGATAEVMLKMVNPKVRHNPELGEILDPGADKLTFDPPLPVFANMVILQWWIVVPILLLELLSTVIRRPFNLFKKFFKGEKKEKQSRDKATGFGKIKVFVQFSTLLVCGPLALGWTEYSLWIPNILCFLILLGCISSIVSRTRISKEADEITNGVTEVFDHE